MLTRLGERIGPLIDWVARAALSLGLTPNAVSLLGFSLAILSGLAYGLGRDSGSMYLAGALLLASGGFDALDGAMARLGGMASPLGGFLDSFLDRLGEVAVFLGISYSGRCDATLAASAMAFSLLVSYSRARAEAMGLRMKGIGLAERPERILILSISTFLDLLSAGLALVAVLALITTVQRGVRAYFGLRGGKW